VFEVDLAVPFWEGIQVYEPKAFISAWKCYPVAPCRGSVHLHKYKITLSLHSLLVFSARHPGSVILAFLDL